MSQTGQKRRSGAHRRRVRFSRDSGPIHTHEAQYLSTHPIPYLLTICGWHRPALSLGNAPSHPPSRPQRRTGKLADLLRRCPGRVPSVNAPAIQLRAIHGNGAAASVRGRLPASARPGRRRRSAWALFLSKRTDADFEEGRQERGWTARKYAAWARGERVLVR